MSSPAPQAAAHGLSADSIARLLRDGFLTEPRSGVLVVRGAPPTWRQRLQVATLASAGVPVAGFRAAAALHGVDGLVGAPRPEVVVPHRCRLPGVIQHEGPLEPDDIVEIDGIRTTGLARTLCDLGSVAPAVVVQTAFEWAWRRGTSLVWLRTTAERLHRPGQRGTGVMLRLLDRADEHVRPTESALELRVERALRGIPGLVRQHEVRRADGSFVARVDFAVPAARVAIEAHSRQFHFGLDRPHADARREAELQLEGWLTRYVTDTMTRRPAQLRHDVGALIAARLATKS